MPADPAPPTRRPFDGTPFLRPGEVIREPFDWTIRRSEPAWCVEAGYPIQGCCFNAFAVGWGRTPDEARDSRMRKTMREDVFEMYRGQVWPPEELP